MLAGFKEMERLVWQRVREEERRGEVPALPGEIQVKIPVEKGQRTAEIREGQAAQAPQGAESRWILQSAMKLF